MPSEPAAQIAMQLEIPIYGIGAGSDVDGQLVIMHDLMGFYQSFRPWFAKCYIPEVVNRFNEYLGAADGTNTLFTLDKTPTASKNIAVFVNGMMQAPATSITSAPFQDYSVTGSSVFFTSSSIPEEGSLLFANYTTNDSTS